MAAEPQEAETRRSRPGRALATARGGKSTVAAREVMAARSTRTALAPEAAAKQDGIGGERCFAGSKAAEAAQLII